MRSAVLLLALFAATYAAVNGNEALAVAFDAALFKLGTPYYTYFDADDYVRINDCPTDGAQHTFPTGSATNGTLQDIITSGVFKIGYSPAVLPPYWYGNNATGPSGTARDVVTRVVAGLNTQYSANIAVQWVYFSNVNDLFVGLNNGTVDAVQPYTSIGGVLNNFPTVNGNNRRRIYFRPACNLIGHVAICYTTKASGITTEAQLLSLGSNTVIATAGAGNLNLVRQFFAGLSVNVTDFSDADYAFSLLNTSQVQVVCGVNPSNVAILSDFNKGIAVGSASSSSLFFRRDPSTSVAGDEELAQAWEAGIIYVNSVVGFESLYNSSYEYRRVTDCTGNQPFPSPVGTLASVVNNRQIIMGTLNTVNAPWRNADGTGIALNFARAVLARLSTNYGANINLLIKNYTSSDDMYAALTNGSIHFTSPFEDLAGVWRGVRRNVAFRPTCSAAGTDITCYTLENSTISSSIALKALGAAVTVAVPTTAIGTTVKTYLTAATTTVSASASAAFASLNAGSATVVCGFNPAGITTNTTHKIQLGIVSDYASFFRGRVYNAPNNVTASSASGASSAGSGSGSSAPSGSASDDGSAATSMVASFVTIFAALFLALF